MGAEAGARRLALPPDEAHVWYAWTKDCDRPANLAYYRSLLNAEEAEQVERFVFAPLKVEYLATRALCRTVLSAYAARAPADWRFRSNRYGRPEIDNAPRPGVMAPRFNLSNSPKLVACVVTRALEAGIDVEDVTRPLESMAIAEHYFAPSELAALQALPPAHQRERFFELWTLKESYIKARGLGLSLPLEQFSFRLPGPPLRIVFAPELEDRADAWQFALLRPDQDHLMAVGIRCGRIRRLRLRLRETVPAAMLDWREAGWIEPVP